MTLARSLKAQEEAKLEYALQLRVQEKDSELVGDGSDTGFTRMSRKTDEAAVF